MRRIAAKRAVAAAAGAGLCLAACTESRMAIQPDFGQAVRQDVAAQIADPDARYAGKPAGGADAERVALAQGRYAKGRVIKPTTIATSTVSAGGDDNGGGGGGSGSGGGGGQ